MKGIVAMWYFILPVFQQFFVHRIFEIIICRSFCIYLFCLLFIFPVGGVFWNAIVEYIKA